MVHKVIFPAFNSVDFWRIMYYNPDECLNMFSLDQRIRMRATLSSVRAELCSPENLQAIGANCDISTIIRPPQQLYHIKTHPNPAGEYIYIEYGNSYPGNQKTGISIYNHLGKSILTKSGTDITRVSLAGLPPGFYILHMQTKDLLFKERFIKFASQ